MIKKIKYLYSWIKVILKMEPTSKGLFILIRHQLNDLVNTPYKSADITPLMKLTDIISELDNVIENYSELYDTKQQTRIARITEFIRKHIHMW